MKTVARFQRKFISLAVLGLAMTLAGCGSSSDEGAGGNPPPPGTVPPPGGSFGVQQVCIPPNTSGEFPIGFHGVGRRSSQYQSFVWLCAGQQPGGFSQHCAYDSTAPLNLAGPVAGGTFFASGIDSRISLNVGQMSPSGDTSVTGTLILGGLTLSNLAQSFTPYPTFWNPTQGTNYPYGSNNSAACVTSIAVSLELRGYPSVPEIGEGKVFLQTTRYPQPIVVSF